MFDEDVSLTPPEYNIPINKVGISDIYLPAFYLISNKLKISVLAKVSAYIDLPSNYKGIHASRNYKSIIDVFKNIGKKIDIIKFCDMISKELLSKYPYSSKSHTSVKALVVYPDKTPLNRDSYEKAYIICKSYAKKVSDKIKINRYIGVEAVGITACPSAQRNILNNFIKNLQEEFDKEALKKILDIIPYATHTQRAYAKILIQTPENTSINFLKLINIVRESMSSPTYEFLKRDDETKLIIYSLKNPKFTEDVVREISVKIAEELSELPDSSKIKVCIKSLESIHQHNLIGCLKSSLGEIRNFKN